MIRLPMSDWVAVAVAVLLLQQLVYCDDSLVGLRGIKSILCIRHC